MDLGLWCQEALHCFQILSSDAHGLNKKEPGGQAHLQSSPTKNSTLITLHSELLICGGQECSQILKYNKQPKHAHSNTKISFPTQNLTSDFLPALLEVHNMSEKQDQSKTEQISQFPLWTPLNWKLSLDRLFPWFGLVSGIFFLFVYSSIIFDKIARIALSPQLKL